MSDSRNMSSTIKQNISAINLAPKQMVFKNLVCLDILVDIQYLDNVSY
jgi:hypothetical protein